MSTRRHLAPLSLYLLLALGMTWPLALNLGSAIPGDGFDGWQNVWNLWWMREAWLVEHTSPYVTHMLHFPTGADLRFQTMAPFNGLLFLNIQTALGLLPAYNAAVLFSFVIGGYGAYLLARYALRHSQFPAPNSPLTIHHSQLTINHSPAFLAGLIYAFSPYHFAHTLGHLQLIVLQWLPFYVLFLLRGLDRAEQRQQSGDTRLRPWLIDSLKTGLFLILVGLCDWYYVMYCLLFTALLLGVRLLQRRLTWQGFAGIATAGAIFAAALSPLLLPMIRGASNWDGPSLLRDYSETLDLSADLLAFITPQVFHPLWGDWAAARSASFTATRSEFTLFAGYTVLLLAGIALFTTRKNNRKWNGAGFWLLSSLFFALLALGPVLHIAGRSDLLPGGRQLPLPYALLYNTVPFIKLSRSVSRLDVMVMLSLGVAAAFGARQLSQWLGRGGKRPRLAAAAPILAALLIVVEFLPAPYPLSPPDTPAWYENLAAEPSQRAVLNLPANRERPGYLIYQTVHGKPLNTGYITRDDPQTLWERAPVLSHYRWLGPDIHTTRFDLAGQGMQVLHDLLGTGWVVLDRYKMPGDPERSVTEATTAAIFGSASPIHQDERLTVYAVTEPLRRGPYLILGPGWPPRQIDPAGRVRRSLPPGQAGLTVLAPVAASFSLEIVATLPSASSLSLLAGDGRELARWPGNGQQASLRGPAIDWPAGATPITLRWTPSAVAPSSAATIYEIAIIN